MIKPNVGEIPHTVTSKIIKKNLMTKDAVEIFKKNKSLQSLVVIDDDTPIGLIMRDKIYFQLGTRFGFNLYFEKPVTKVMDKDPLILDYYCPIDEVSKLTMKRSQEKIYDEIIITKRHKYFTTISIKDLLLKISELKVIEAKNANPLSGLPGNISINREIITRIELGTLFSVLYIDLDNFKAYNDCYGYQKGDQIIQYTANTLKSAAYKFDKSAFIGHVGGDDFIIITVPKYDIEMSKEIIHYFNQNLSRFFRPDDWSRGFFRTVNRQKELVNTPLTTISIAIISNEYINITNHLTIGDRASDLKKTVKKMKGSNFLKDRRVNKHCSKKV